MANRDRITPPTPRAGAASPTAPASGETSFWPAAVALVVALLVYWPALHGAFIWDDAGHVTRPGLTSLSGLWKIWFQVGATQQYYPVLHSAFWLEHLAFGNTSTGYHVLNVLLHATAACLFVVTLRRLQVAGAWIAGFLFLLHPVCVESVAWISEQKNTLSTVFYLLAALAYLCFDGNRRPRDYAAASFLFVLALGTKTVTATLPAALLVIFWWQRGRLDLRRDLLPLLPWFIFAAAAGAMTASVEHRLIGAREEDFAFSLLERAFLASRVVWFYLTKLIYPANLSFIYPRWHIDLGTWWQYLFPLGILLLALAAWRWRSRRGAVAAGLFFIGSLFPALGFVNVYPFRFSFVADHFQYLASLGIFAAAGWSLARGLALVPGIPSRAAVVGLMLVLGGLTWRQSATYRDDFVLYASTLEKNPAASLAHNNLGNKLVDAGRAQEAIPHFEAALRLRPNSALYENSYGYALLSLRQPLAAIPRFERVLQLEPNHVRAQFFLGLALKSVGRREEAEAKFRSALQRDPAFAEAHLNLGLLLAQRTEFASAIEHFSTVARLQPKNPDAEFNWALALILTNRLGEALPHFEKAEELAPTRASIRNSHARALTLAGRTDDAREKYLEVLRWDPNLAEAHLNLGQLLRQAGREEEAAPHFSEAARLGRQPAARRPQDEAISPETRDAVAP